ncbi:TPR-like protein [Ceratobasidium sp. AG-I]|nr:TPR-like protein [Ceratobasidium sp. AG-I]
MWTEALADAEETIRVNPNWAKGYARKGAALHGAHRWDEAIAAYEQGIKVEDSPALQKGLREVKEAQAGDLEDPGMGIGKMFSDPNLLGKLAGNPKTSHLLKDEGFVAQLKMIQQNPQLAGSAFNDPRMIQVLGVLMGIDMSATTREEGSNDMPPGFGASGPSSPPPQSSFKPTAPQASRPAEDVKMAEPEPEDEEAKEAKRLKEEAEAEKKKGAEAYKRRDFTAAEEAFKKAWEISPTDITFLTNLAASYFEQGEFDKCIETCEKAVEEGRSVGLVLSAYNCLIY